MKATPRPSLIAPNKGMFLGISSEKPFAECFFVLFIFGKVENLNINRSHDNGAAGITLRDVCCKSLL